MTLLRSLLYFVCMAVTIIIYGLFIALIGWLLPMKTRNRIGNQWSRVNMWLLKTLCGLDYCLRGTENLPGEEAAIVMSKHQSAWETIALRGIIGGNQSWVLKRELMWIPFFGWAIAIMEPIAINRKAGRKAVKQVIRQGSEYLARGNKVILFPEGTRTAPGSRGRYKLGGAILAEKSGCKVVPVCHNAGVFWRRRDIRKYPGTIDVVIGKPIATEGRKAQEILDEVENWIETTLETLPQRKENHA
jgi:1-acyl-sn-glycerol-3-phosphate acyltransferase